MLKTLVTVLFLLAPVTGKASSVKFALVGNIPGQYFDTFNFSKDKHYLGVITMSGRVIETIYPILDQTKIGRHQAYLEDKGYQVIPLGGPTTGFDIIYPGLIDLHGHNKQNMLPTWTSAFGRFANRHEWRKDSREYGRVQGDNMNPWSSPTPSRLAAYRWSELQAMVLGTTYLQGHILYDSEFAIHSVEDKEAFISQRGGIESGGDYVDPYKWSFLWNELRHEINNLCEPSFDCYQQALTHWFEKNCHLKNLLSSDFAPEISILDFARWESDDEIEQKVNALYEAQPLSEEAWLSLIFEITEIAFQAIDTRYARRKIDFYLELRARFQSKEIVTLLKNKDLSDYQKLSQIEEWVETWTVQTTKVIFRDKIVGIPRQVAQDPVSDQALQWFKSSEVALVESCDVEKPEELVDFFADTFGNKPHPTIVRRNETLSDPLGGAIITHLSEGRRLDPVSWVEFQLLRLAGLAREGMNFIHGVGLTPADFRHMAQHNMGLVWSPYSNFLLYGETVNLRAALEAGVRVALGSDWAPTGSKSVLDELRVATEYLDKNNIKINRDDCDSLDECVFNMVTKNSALIMNHYGFEGPNERGVGTLEVGAMASLIAVKNQDQNPFTNLVRKTRVQDINLVVVDGKPIYGNQSYLSGLKGLPAPEVISGRIFSYTLDQNPEVFPKPLSGDELVMGVAKAAAELKLTPSQRCGFSEPKVFLQGRSRQDDFAEKVQPVLEATGLNLDSYTGITKYLGVAMLSQSHNVRDGRSLSEGRVGFMPPLYSCEDPAYWDYLDNMVSNEWGLDTLTFMKRGRQEARLARDLVTTVSFEEGEWMIDYSEPHELALLYHLVPAPAVGEPRSIIEVERSETAPDGPRNDQSP